MESCCIGLGADLEALVLLHVLSCALSVSVCTVSVLQPRGQAQAAHPEASQGDGGERKPHQQGRRGQGRGGARGSRGRPQRRPLDQWAHKGRRDWGDEARGLTGGGRGEGVRAQGLYDWEGRGITAVILGRGALGRARGHKGHRGLSTGGREGVTHNLGRAKWH